MLWRLFLAVFHVEAQGAVESAKGVETTPGMLGRLYAAIGVHEMDYWCGRQDSCQ